METLAADVDFLTRNEIMDYSMLLGIHDTEREDDREEPEEEEEEEDYDSGGSGGAALTPPDSPGIAYKDLGLIPVTILHTVVYSYWYILYIPVLPPGQ